MSSHALLTELDDSAAGLIASLNAEQRAAVTLPAEHALILAGAGSGKTRVLTTRIAWLMSSGQVGPGGVLAVTFTNKAAREMSARLSAMLPLSVRGMWIGTFHGLCNRFLRAHWRQAQLPQSFQILDSQDQLSAIKRLMKAHQIDEERFPAKQTQWFISSCKEDGLRAGMVEARTADDRKRVEIYQLYEDQCQREGVVDFGELLLRSYELLRDDDALRSHYQRRFRHVLIDEFQDTNKLQYAWIQLFMGQGAAIFAVGDDDQSIYAFRGARVGNMSDFVREHRVRHQIKLEENYRSMGNILDTANELISHNKSRLGKNLRTERGPGEPVRIQEAPGDLAEAQWLVDEVRHLVRGEGGDPGSPRSEIAVLYRSNAQSRVLETALFNAGVPYRVFGGLRFFERAEVKHALAYLRLIENPRDDTSFVRVVNFPPRGIGSRTLEQLQDAARDLGVTLHDAVAGTAGRAGNKLADFAALMEAMRQDAAPLNLRQIIELVLERSGLLAHYRQDRDGADRLENLDELVNAAESFVTQEGFGRDAVGLESVDAQRLGPDIETGETLSPLAAFLTHAALESGDNQAEAGQDAVQLMTVHSAKGLEFDCVFITGLEEGLFPHENALSDHDGLEEERRLMYVAITRARKRLYLSHAVTRMLHGQTRYNLRSRFVDELPATCLKWLTPRAPRGASPWVTPGGHWGEGTRSGRSGQSWEASAPAVPIRRTDAAAPASAASGQSLRVAMRVFHNKFGEGKILALEGAGTDARAQVSFNRHGIKWLALSVAKLTPVD